MWIHPKDCCYTVENNLFYFQDKILNNNSARKKEIERHEEEIILANKMSTVSTELNTDLPIIQNTLKESNFLHNNDRLVSVWKKIGKRMYEY